MSFKVYYNGQETNDFNTLAAWFYEVYGKMLRLEEANKQLREANEQYRDDYTRLKNGYDEFKRRNSSLESERSKTVEVLKRYCGSLVGPIPTIVGMVIDDFFYQKAETECQVKELQKAEKTIDKLNKELVEYADKVEKLEKKLWNPDWCRVIDKLDEIIDKEAPIPYACRKVYTNAEDEIWDKLNYLAMSLCARNILNDVKNKHIRELENKVNDLDVTNRRLELDNEKLIFAQGDNAIEHAAEITELKQEISALKTKLEEQKKKNSRLFIVTENHRLRDEVESLKGQIEVLKMKNSYPIRPVVLDVDGRISNLRDENDKLKRTLEFCQKEASAAREHAHNVEVNAERIRKGLD